MANKDPIIYHCETCPEQFLTRGAMMLHSRTHLEVVKFTCLLCQSVFDTNEELIEHKYVHDTEEQCFKCNKCKVAFSKHLDYLHHCLRHTKQTIYKCDECSYTYYNQRTFRRHISTHYDRKLKCKVCDKIFKQYKDLLTHRRNLHETGIQCVECGKSCQTRRDHEEHMVSHTGVKVFQCLYCGKGFSRAALRRNHTRKHTKSKPYECKLCSQKFVVKNNLKLHMITHETVKKYECNDCGKKFFHRISIIHHTRQHLNYGLLECPCCERSFTTYQYLNDHMQVAHIKHRQFKCDICNVTFILKKALVGHEKTRSHRNNVYALSVKKKSV